MRDEMMIVTVCKTFIIRQFMIYSLLFLNRYSGLKLDTLVLNSLSSHKISQRLLLWLYSKTDVEDLHGYND